MQDFDKRAYLQHFFEEKPRLLIQPTGQDTFGLFEEGRQVVAFDIQSSSITETSWAPVVREAHFRLKDSPAPKVLITFVPSFLQLSTLKRYASSLVKDDTWTIDLLLWIIPYQKPWHFSSTQAGNDLGEKYLGLSGVSEFLREVCFRKDVYQASDDFMYRVGPYQGLRRSQVLTLLGTAEGRAEAGTLLVQTLRTWTNTLETYADPLRMPGGLLASATRLFDEGLRRTREYLLYVPQEERSRPIVRECESLVEVLQRAIDRSRTTSYRGGKSIQYETTLRIRVPARSH